MTNIQKDRQTHREAEGRADRQTDSSGTYLSDAQPVGHDAVHGVGVHLGPLELEAVHARPVLPQWAVGVVVELGRVGFTWRENATGLAETRLAETRLAKDS